MSAVDQLTRMAMPAERSLARLEQPRACLDVLAVDEQALLPCERDALATIAQLAAMRSASAALAGAIVMAEQAPEEPRSTPPRAAHVWEQARAPEHEKPKPAELASWLARGTHAHVGGVRSVSDPMPQVAEPSVRKQPPGHAARQRLAAAWPKRTLAPASIAADSSRNVARLVGSREQARTHLGQLCARAGANAPITALPAEAARVCAAAFQELAVGAANAALPSAALSGAVERALSARSGPAPASSTPTATAAFAEPASQSPRPASVPASQSPRPASVPASAPKDPPFTFSAAQSASDTTPLTAASDTPLRRLARFGAAPQNESPTEPADHPNWPTPTQDPDDEALAQRLGRVLRWHAKRQGLNLGSGEEQLP